MSTLLNNIKSILIIRCGALGDLVFATAVSNALINEYGDDIKIDWVCTPGSSKLLAHDPHANKIFLLKHKKFPIFFSSQKRAIVSYSHMSPYDLMINLETGKQFFDLARAINARHKIGAPFTYAKNTTPDIHMVDLLKATAAPVLSETTLEHSYPKLYGTAWEEVQRKYALPETYLMLNPSNSHAKRNKINYRAWPEEHWSTLINRLAPLETLLITAGPSEVPSLSYLQPLSSKFIDLIGKTSIPDLITIIAHAKAIVTTDTGPTHIAAAVNTPIFVLMGPTPPSTGPYKTPNSVIKVLNANLECSPCYRTPVMEACRDNICMKEITPDMVIDAIKEFNETNAKMQY